MTPLTDLLRRVEGAKDRNALLRQMVPVDLSPYLFEMFPNGWTGKEYHQLFQALFHGGFTEATELVEHLFPGQQWRVVRWGPADGSVTAQIGDEPDVHTGNGANPAMAAIAATLRAMIARSGSSQSSVPACC